jgi:hypothetical protein
MNMNGASRVHEEPVTSMEVEKVDDTTFCVAVGLNVHYLSIE